MGRQLEKMNKGGLSSVANAAVGEAHRRHVCHLYKRALKLQLDWLVKRETWYPEANKTRALFRQHMNETDPRTISRLVKDTENLLYTYRHPDPYVSPMSGEAPSGSETCPFPWRLWRTAGPSSTTKSL